MTGTRQCSLSIQSLPTASEIARGTESFDEIRRDSDSIPFRMHDISYCKPVLQSGKSQEIPQKYDFVMVAAMCCGVFTASLAFGARFQVEKKPHKMQLHRIGPLSHCEHAPFVLQKRILSL
jgi:hypothetical protein